MSAYKGKDGTVLKREIFDKVYEHMISQNKKCEIINEEDDIPNCAYKHDGLSCAVGCLIKNQYYNPEIEGSTIAMQKVQIAVEESLGCKLSDGDIQGLIALQGIHDCNNSNAWEASLKQLKTCLYGE